MLLNVKDSAGDTQIVVVQAQENPSDASGVIVADGVSQTLVGAFAERSGFLIQNLSVENPMYINEIGGDATSPGSFMLVPRAFFPPPGYPVPTGDINIAGSMGDRYAARVW